MKKQLYATDINWETDGQGTCGLPKEVNISNIMDIWDGTDEQINEVNEYLSKEYGFLVNGYNVELK